MTDQELLIECKKNLGIPADAEETAFDPVLLQKILIVKSYMKGAGVSETMLEDALSVGVIVLGVTDLWNIVGGETKFSPAFGMLLEQLVVRSLP
ncbi:hypothetical protein [Anaerosolibacter sp.]|uniref:hypothetical protein n=1 Tax=Anaerosolibacter sp. TaxID=1872527 RepID=UPI0039F0418B